MVPWDSVKGRSAIHDVVKRFWQLWNYDAQILILKNIWLWNAYWKLVFSNGYPMKESIKSFDWHFQFLYTSKAYWWLCSNVLSEKQVNCWHSSPLFYSVWVKRPCKGRVASSILRGNQKRDKLSTLMLTGFISGELKSANHFLTYRVGHRYRFLCPFFG